MHQADMSCGTLHVLAGWRPDGDDADQILATVESLPSAPGGSVLEVGFGPGAALQLLAHRTDLALIAGIDDAEPRVRAARRRLADMPATVGLDLRFGRADCLPFADDSFDVVYAVNAYRQWPDRSGALAEMAGVLKPGGELVLSIREVRVEGRFEAAGDGARAVCEAVPELRRLGLATEVEEIFHSDARATFLVRGRKAKV